MLFLLQRTVRYGLTKKGKEEKVATLIPISAFLCLLGWTIVSLMFYILDSTLGK